ncbi:insect cuticle protein domain-containing protein [Phthorimaea operculella]|nr:insect cuticle protein domain-containing protein [Phthorimaea operculella]
MKLLIVAAVISVCACARLDNKYLPPRGNDGAGYSGGSFGAAPGGFGGAGGHGGAGGFGARGGAGFGGTQHAGNAYNAGAAGGYSGQGGFGGQQQFKSNPADANAQILRSNSEVTAEGFSYDFETSNGIRADASGVATNGVQSQGSFGYTGDDGQQYSITYTADENGYRPVGAHLPTPPPIPEEILKSLEQNARDEAAGISDDGSYHGEGAGSGAGGYGAAPSSNYGAPSAGFGQSGSFGGHSNFGGQSAGFGRQSGGQSGGFGGQSGSFGARGGAASRQYLAPKQGPARPSGNGNFNQQSGYQY